MHTFNGKVADDSIKIENHQVQTGWRFAPAPDLFSHISRITGNDIYHYKETCEVLIDFPKIGGVNTLKKNSIRNI